MGGAGEKAPSSAGWPALQGIRPVAHPHPRLRRMVRNIILVVFFIFIKID